jgi:hypothetical protein
LRLELHEQRLRRLDLRRALGQRRPLRGVLQSREHLAGCNVLALLDQHLPEGASDLRGYRRLTARGHVAGGLQDCGRAGGGRWRCGNRRFDLESLPPQYEQCDARRDQQEGNDNSRGDPQAAPGAGMFVTLRGIDPQLFQQHPFVCIGRHRTFRFL